MKKEPKNRKPDRLPRKGLEFRCYGPVTHEDAMFMARVTKDFHPAHLIGDGPDSEGGKLSLHPLWVSGLVIRALSRIVPDCVAISLRIEHKARSYVNDTLSVELGIGSESSASGGGDVKFVIRNQDHGIIARGAVQLDTSCSDHGT